VRFDDTRSIVPLSSTQRFTRLDGRAPQLKQAARVFLNMMYPLYAYKDFPTFHYVAGGACTSVFSNARINDMDVFFLKKEDADSVSRYLVSAAGEDKPNWVFVARTAHADTFKHIKTGNVYQIIHAIYGPPSTVMAQFDFTIAQCAWIPAWDPFEYEKFEIADAFFQHLAQRKLYFTCGTQYPIASLWRMRKFLRRGFTIDAVNLTKIALAIHALKLDTMQQFKEQMLGIDAAWLGPILDEFNDSDSFKATHVASFIEGMVDATFDPNQEQGA